jgi:hypothetical protein
MALSSITKFCKENKIIFGDYSHKFVELKCTKIREFIEKVQDDKYKKIMFYLDLSKIHSYFAKAFQKVYSLERDHNETGIIFYNGNVQTILVEDEVPDMVLKRLTDKNRTCVVCLNELEQSIGCDKCSADYCDDCLFDSNYGFKDDDNNLLCCICKGIVGIYDPE